MRTALAALRSLFDSLTGRMVLILTVGMAAASIASLLVADYARVHDFRHARYESVVDSASDLAQRFAHDPAQTLKLLHDHKIFSVGETVSPWPDVPPDPTLQRMLAERLGPKAEAQAKLLPLKACFPNVDMTKRAAGILERTLPDCWFVQFRDDGGVVRRLEMAIASANLPRNSTLEPMYPAVIVLASALLALFVARVTTSPLRRLTLAAKAFSVTSDPDPIPEQGPMEVRMALQTFNMMQHRVRDGFRERTQILASIAHDLQTPLTRLRLRLDHVTDQALRERLFADLEVMQQLVRDGLDLARSVEIREPWLSADIDSILSSVAEDAAEFGADVHFVGGCGARARIKPNALVRCLNNLVDNAVKYGGGAELSSLRDGKCLLILVRDHGPGMPEAALEQAIQPFTRLAPPQGAREGTGIGLAIASTLARAFGAELTLSNHAAGGLLATVRLGPLSTGPRATSPRA